MVQVKEDDYSIYVQCTFIGLATYSCMYLHGNLPVRTCMHANRSMPKCRLNNLFFVGKKIIKTPVRALVTLN